MGEFGYFRAEYDPSKETLTISVPIEFSFLDSDVETNQLVGDPHGNKPVELVTVKETKRWSPKEIEKWRKKFIKTVEGTWSGKHTIYCHRPEWEGLKARVIVKVDVMGEEIPANLEPFRAKVFRGISRRVLATEKGSAFEKQKQCSPMRLWRTAARWRLMNSGIC